MSGVYIPGMEMPKDGEHPYWVTIHSDGIIEYNKNKGQGWQTSEAVPVPDHGRLIDADALLDVWDDNHTIPSAAAKVIVKTIIPADQEDSSE